MHNTPARVLKPSNAWQPSSTLMFLKGIIIDTIRPFSSSGFGDLMIGIPFCNATLLENTRISFSPYGLREIIGCHRLCTAHPVTFKIQMRFVNCK